MKNITKIPKYTKVLIIGGGPAGSIAASILARECVQVTLLEKEKFPRYHIGESLLNLFPLFEFIGVQSKLESHGFTKKYEGFFRIKHGQKAGHIDLRTSNPDNKPAYQVIRSEFDKILLDHSREMGASVFEESEVTKINFLDNTPISAEWKSKKKTTGTIEFDFLIDASGLSGIMSNKYLNNREFQETFANVAIGSYWNNYNDYIDDDGITHKGAFSMESLVDGSGWLWAIPLHNGTLSVGAVIHRKVYSKLLNEFKNVDLIYNYLLSLAKDIHFLIKDSQRIEKVRMWQDYSYAASNFSGNKYRLIGDAAGFIDPLFSSGVHLAAFGALSASATICATIRGERTEEESGAFHNKCIRVAYTRFVIMVAGIYQQILNQQDFVLPNVLQEEMQKAFEFIQPIVSGNIDLNNKNLSKKSLLKTIDYARGLSLVIHNLKTMDENMKNIIEELKDSPYFGIPVNKNYTICESYIRMKTGELGLEKCKKS